MMRQILLCGCLSAAACFEDAPLPAGGTDGATDTDIGTDAGSDSESSTSGGGTTQGSTETSAGGTTGADTEGNTEGASATSGDSTGTTGADTGSTGGAGSTGSTTGGGSTGSTTDPDPGTFYAHCYTTDDCVDDLICRRIEGNDPRGYCTRYCTADSDCVAPAWFGAWGGTLYCPLEWAEPRCATDCTAVGECPGGMECSDLGVADVCFWFDP